MDLLELFDRASRWTSSKVSGASDKLESPTECEEWDARTLVNHLVDTADYFTSIAQGKEASPPSKADPPDVIGSDPVASYEKARQSVIETYSKPGVIDKTGPSLGFAFADHLIHGWDLAKGTGQDATMPADLAEEAFRLLDGNLNDKNRGSSFKKKVSVPEDASAQEKLLGYAGRQP